MEVDIRLGVCNNSPAELASPENGWRSSEQPRLNRKCYNCCGCLLHLRVGGRGGSVTKPLVVRPGGTASSADLGCSRKYSNESFED